MKFLVSPVHTVFGLSGGVDSAVIGALCRRAFPDDCLGLIMPCYSAAEDVEDAGLVARELGIPTSTVNLDGVLDALLQALPDDGEDAGARRLAEANLKPRLRMATLYYFANRRRYLVVGTGNRSEATMGYCTKYGDAGVDFGPYMGKLPSNPFVSGDTTDDVTFAASGTVPSDGATGWWMRTDTGEFRANDVDPNHAEY